MPEKTIVFDLDDTICYPNHLAKTSHEKYALAKPNEIVIQSMHELKGAGYKIIISTARRMLTHGGDIDKIVNDVGQITIDWLHDNNVPYDSLCFGKPYSNTWYVDDKAMNLKDYYRWVENELRSR